VDKMRLNSVQEIGCDTNTHKDMPLKEEKNEIESQKNYSFNNIKKSLKKIVYPTVFGLALQTFTLLTGCEEDPAKFELEESEFSLMENFKCVTYKTFPLLRHFPPLRQLLYDSLECKSKDERINLEARIYPKKQGAKYEFDKEFSNHDYVPREPYKANTLDSCNYGEDCFYFTEVTNYRDAFTGVFYRKYKTEIWFRIDNILTKIQGEQNTLYGEEDISDLLIILAEAQSDKIKRIKLKE